MTSRYSQWAGPLADVGRFEWERVIKRCSFKQQSTKLIALLLATYASEDGSSVRPGRERLSVVAGLSTKHVSTQLGKLEDLGLVLKLRNGSSYGRRGGLASVYQLTVPANLYMAYEDANELDQVEIEGVFAHVMQMREQRNPSSHVPEKHGNPVSPVSTPKLQEHVNSEPEQGNSESEHVNSEPEHVNPRSLHQSRNTTQEIPIKKDQTAGFSYVTREPTRESENAGSGFSSIAAERSRQLKALDALIEKGEAAS